MKPLVAGELMKGAEHREIVAGPQPVRMEYSTLMGASGWVVGRRLVFRVDHVVAIGLMLASLTVVCGKRLGEIPTDSWLQPP